MREIYTWKGFCRIVFPVFSAFGQEADIRLLIGEAVFTEDFLLIGRDDITTNPGRKKLEEIMEGTKKENRPCIVIDHNPLGIKEALLFCI